MPSTFTWSLASEPSPGDAEVGASALSGRAVMRDLLLDSGGDLQVTDDFEAARGGAAIAQALRISILLFRGEWFENLDLGTPYFEDVLVKRPNLQSIRSIFRSRILDVPGVSAIEDLKLNFDPRARALEVSATIATDTEELIRIEAREAS